MQGDGRVLIPLLTPRPMGVHTLVSDIFVNSTMDLGRVYAEMCKQEFPFKVKLTRGGKRSLEQNAYLWGVCYEMILESGLREQGWRNTDVHEYFLGEHFGWETLDGLGRKRVRPLNRSSVLTKMEFVDYVAFIQERAAQMGIVIPDPEA